MLRVYVIVLSSIVLSACSVFGVRSGTEETRFEVVERIGDRVEIRRYEPRLVAEVTVASAGKDDSSNSAFRILAGYIFGGNKARRDIAMTSPVEIRGESVEIAMTAPVEITDPESDTMTMRFFLPASISLDDAPTPDDDRVRIFAVPEALVAAVKYSGSRSDSAFNRERVVLLEELAASKWSPVTDPVGLYYDPPWTIPFLRRNEVAVGVVGG
ncbi:MAG: heme-binding protein [Pseudomonadota bacterium]